MFDWIGLVGQIVQTAGSVTQGFMAKQNYEDQARLLRYNAEVLRENAKAVKQKFKFEQGRQAEEAARVQGELEASIGGSGTVSTQGAPMLALALQRSESDLQNYLIGYEGRSQVKELESQADILEFQAKYAERAGDQALVAGWFNAGSSMMQGMGNMGGGQPYQKTLNYQPPRSGFDSRTWSGNPTLKTQGPKLYSGVNNSYSTASGW